MTINRRQTSLGFALTLGFLLGLSLWRQAQLASAAPLVFAPFSVTNTGDNGGVNPAIKAGTGKLDQVNGGIGVRLDSGSSTNTLGGTSAAERNVIAGKSGIGVHILGAATGNGLRGNAIFNHTSLGIDLGNNGVTANDALAADTGLNKLQNFLVLDSLTTPGTVTSTLDASGNGEGEVFLGEKTLNAPGAFTLSYAPVQGKPVITSTATDANGNTSEFSTLACSPLSVLTVNHLGDLPDANTDDGVCADSAGNCTLRAALMQANAIPACVPATINFTVTGVINLTGALPNIAVNLTINGPGANLLTVRRDTGGDYGIFVSNGVGKDVAIHGLTISNGKATIGGAIFFLGTAASGSLTLTDCVISGNEAGSGGGVFVDGKATISGCTISGNTASAQGGGINYQGFFSPSRTMRIINSTISGNTVVVDDSDAAILNAAFSGSNHLEVINSTIVNNTNPFAHPLGAILSYARRIGSPPSATTVLRNSIIANNTAPNLAALADGPNTSATMTSLGNNLTSDNGGGFLTGPGDLINTNPLLAPLGNYGGPTLTHALLPGSPAINAGNNCVLTNTCANNNLDFNLTNDQRGVQRPQNTTVDIGAVEAQAFTLALTGGNNQSTPINTAFPTALQVNLKEGAFNLPGAVITFAAPGSGASLDPVSGTATTDANGNVSRAVTANTIVGGPYAVVATTGPLSQSFSLTNTCPSITLTPSLPGGVLGTAYNQTVVASPAGGNYSYTVTGLPPGLTMTGSGLMSGTPTQLGTFNVRVTATGWGNCVGFRDYVLTVVCPALSFTSATLPGAQAGVAYDQTLSVNSAGSFTFSLFTGNLPPGLNLNAATGQLSGPPAATGTYQFSVQALGASGCGTTQTFTLVVTCPTITVSPASLPNGTVGTVYNQSLSATPTGNYSFSKTSGSLPPGLSLSPNGSLSGTPTTAGTYSFTLTASGFGNCSGSQSYTVTINSSCATITLPVLPATGTFNVNYTGNLAATTPSGSYTFSVESGTLPPGLALDNLFAQLRGKPTAAGSYSFALKATRSNGCTGTRQYTVVISGGALVALARTADYDGDGQSDLTLWSGTSGRWQILRSRAEELQTLLWGGMGDISLLGDYDGDGQSDLAVFRPANGTWYVKRSSDGSALVKVWGAATDVPVPGDYDGDGVTDLAVWRPAAGSWYVLKSSDGGYETKVWGLGVAPYLDVPVASDYDGDGVTDLAVFRRQTGTWLIQRSSDGQFTSKAWGAATDVPVVGDYDGDGQADLAVWRGATGEWLVLCSSDGHYEVNHWGALSAGDVPAPGDYDGDGWGDLAVWRATEQTWYVLGSRAGVRLRPMRGQVGDRPVNAR